MNPPVQQPFWFNPPRSSPLKDMSGDGSSDFHHYPIGPQGAGSIIGVRDTKGLNHLGSLHLPQTVVSRVIGVHYQQCLQCHPDLTSQMDQGIPDEVDDTKKKHV